jgi:hypothetical protein
MPYWTTSVFSSTVTDLILRYESVTYESLRTNDQRRMTEFVLGSHSPATALDDDCLTSALVLSLILRPTISRPVYLGVKHPSGAYDQILITVRQLRVC